MSLANEKTKKVYLGNGSTVVYPYDFKVFNKAHLLVLVAGVEMTVGTDYNVSGVGESSGGNVTFDTAPANESTVIIMRVMTAIQETAYTTSGAFPATAHEAALDRGIMLAQQIKEILTRIPTLSVAEYEGEDLEPLAIASTDPDSSALIIISDTEPTSPFVGQIWVDTSP